MADLNSIKPRNRQTGAAAIEFALLFLLFFVLFYALVSYAFVFMLQNAFVHAAEEGARAAISVDPLAYASNSNYINNGVTPEVRNTVGAALDWLPSKAKAHALGVNNGNVQVRVSDNVLTVKIIYANYRSDPLLPMLNFPGFGPIIPESLQGRAILKLF